MRPAYETYQRLWPVVDAEDRNGSLEILRGGKNAEVWR